VGLKPQDLLILLKYWSLKRAGQASSVRGVAEEIGVSPGEVSKGTKRLVASHLLVERSGAVFAEAGAMLEWLSFGIRYAYPQESVGYGRGMATSWNCPLIDSEVVAPAPPLVWAVPGGDVDGALIRPVHASVPYAAGRDPDLYRMLSLLEAIRGGKPRELVIARALVSEAIKGK
jgi:hypothetical protein